MNRRRQTGSIVSALICLTGVLGAQAAYPDPDRPVPGQYEVTTRTTFEEVPIPGTTVTTTNCLTQEDLDKDPASAFAELPEGRSCEIGEFVMEGGNISMRVSCNTEEGSMDMVVTGSYDTSSYTMNSQVVVVVGEDEVRMQSAIEGKLVGDC